MIRRTQRVCLIDRSFGLRVKDPLEFDSGQPTQGKLCLWEGQQYCQGTGRSEFSSFLKTQRYRVNTSMLSLIQQVVASYINDNPGNVFIKRLRTKSR